MKFIFELAEQNLKKIKLVHVITFLTLSLFIFLFKTSRYVK